MSTTEPETVPMTILCAGLNAHNQLQAGTAEDIHSFTPLPLPEGTEADHPEVLIAGWSQTALSTSTQVSFLGHGSNTIPVSSEPNASSAFGDHNGLIGFLSLDGSLTIASPTNDPSPNLENLTTKTSPRLSHIALAGNDRIAITFQQAPNGNLCHIAEFANVQKFTAWYQDPSAEGNYPDAHHMLPGRPKQLVANIASFLLLLEDGRVYTWGDPRHQSLGRSITANPAEKPGLVDALDGVKIARIAAEGWMAAAVSRDMALYLWGTGMPGTGFTIKCLREAEAGDVVLVSIPGEDGEPLDVVHLGIGDGHVAVVTDDGGGGTRLWVAGANGCGQLGLGSEESWVDDWTSVEGVCAPRRVQCGPKSTFVSVLMEPETHE